MPVVTLAIAFVGVNVGVAGSVAMAPPGVIDATGIV